jgi:D-alanyl-D-alanine carboxypeptidase
LQTFSQKFNFIEKMNSFAKNSKANSTKFYNCTGLDGEGNGVNILKEKGII